MRESVIEKKVCAHAKKLGYWPVKLNPINSKGLPDRMFIGEGNDVLFIEFKAPKKKPTKLQWHNINKLKSLGCEVYVVDDIEQGKDIFDARHL